MSFKLLDYTDAYVLVEISKLSRGRYQIAVIDEEFPFQSVEIDYITYMTYFETKDVVITQCKLDPITLEGLGMNIFGLSEKHRGGYQHVIY